MSQYLSGRALDFESRGLSPFIICLVLYFGLMFIHVDCEIMGMVVETLDRVHLAVVTWRDLLKREGNHVTKLNQVPYMSL
jgi:hypothetical protein